MAGSKEVPPLQILFWSYREVGVLQVLGAADGHLQTTVEHLEPETETRKKRCITSCLGKYHLGFGSCFIDHIQG